MNIEIKTTWHNWDSSRYPNYISHKTFSSLEKLRKYIESRKFSEDLFSDLKRHWFTIELIDKDTERLIIGSDIWSADGVDKAQKFIALCKEEYNC